MVIWYYDTENHMNETEVLDIARKYIEREKLDVKEIVSIRNVPHMQLTPSGEFRNVWVVQYQFNSYDEDSAGGDFGFIDIDDATGVATPFDTL